MTSALAPLDGWSEPRDEAAERSVIGTVLRAGTIPDRLRELVGPGDFWNPQLRTVAEVCWDLTARARPCDAITVRAQLLQRGGRGRVTAPDYLQELDSDAIPASSPYHARQIRTAAHRRQIITAAGRALQQAADPEHDPYDLAAGLVVSLEQLAEQASQATPSAIPLERFVQGSTEYDWQIPGLIEHGDRVIITGTEGGGKSVLTRQFAVTCAAGLHPFTGRFLDKPMRVTLVDLENGERTLRRHLVKLRNRAADHGSPVPDGGMHVESLPAGVDLIRPDGAAWLENLCAATTPDLLVIGPLYRMHTGDMGKEDGARQMTAVVDRVRARHGCSVLMESHAAHANGTTGARSLRPIGSSLFLRWPEFGYGLQPTDERGVVQFRAWRGDRDERSWPTHLRWGSEVEWPWMVHNPNAGLPRFDPNEE